MAARPPRCGRRAHWCPSWRSGEAAGAVEAGRPASLGREASSVAAPCPSARAPIPPSLAVSRAGIAAAHGLFCGSHEPRHEQDTQRQIPDRAGGPAPPLPVPRRCVRHRSRVQPHRGVVAVDPCGNPAAQGPAFYHLFAENAETEYIAYVSEQNLLPDTSNEPIRHPQVAEAFERDDGGSYRLRNATLN